MPLNSPNVRHIGILLLVSISTISPQLTCHSAPVCEILSKSDRLQHKKLTSYRFLTVREGVHKFLILYCIVFLRWQISAILNFRGLILGSLKCPCTTSYRTSMETIALNCLVFETNRVFAFWRQTDKHTDRQTDRQQDKQTNRWTAPTH